MPTPNPLIPGAVSQAGLDLGMGSELQNQVMNEVLERRKRTLLAANQQPGSFGALALGVGINGTGNTGGMALQALMNTGVPNG